MINNYWIKRLEEVQMKNLVLEKENKKLQELVIKHAPLCKHYDGNTCHNIQGKNNGKDCDYPWGNNCYEDPCENL